MSVVAVDLLTRRKHIFVKGAPEQIVQHSLKSSFDAKCTLDNVDIYSLDGYRVLGLAYKEVSEDMAVADRESAESELIYLGMCLFENPLKPQTLESMVAFGKSLIDCKIVTGDNQFTALAIAD